MQVVKVLHKGQITLPRKIREGLGIKEGDTLVIERDDMKIILKKGKTIHDYIGFLPKPTIPIEKVIEESTEEAISERVQGIY